ncbi:MAG TPA: crossover junction endodeoxyribonuclease RuvC [Candidatus Limnocylindrales bacterium]|jgi:crossover junction endodeoxyribonuclease RuvC|nr:crossover junction endodeoxyribonuclease RuvC [Candidatus Limnocylindrales bacterium]
MIVLGIDPGTAVTGYGLVEREGARLRAVDYGTLETPVEWALPQRLLAIHEAVEALITAHRPDLVAVERIFFNRNAQSAFAVGQARGAVLLAAARHGIIVHEYGPHEVKIAVTGYGRADKGQVQRMVQVLLGMPALPRPDDAADALAVAICLAHAERPAA